MCNFEKHIKDFYKRYIESKDCNSKRRLKRYYENKVKTSNQREVKYQKKIKKNYYRIKLINIYILRKNTEPMLN